MDFYNVIIITNYYRENLSSPRVLSCLHVFCEACIDESLVENKDDLLKTGGTVICPECQQSTNVSLNYCNC